MLSVVCWKWGSLFSAEYVLKLHSMLTRHLHLPHRLFCVTDDSRGIDQSKVEIVPMPHELREEKRCRRRMWQLSAERVALFGSRMLSIDLDVVIVKDITPLINRPEQLVCWKVTYANVYSGSLMLMDTGVLDGAWRRYQRDPEGFIKSTGERNASDQALINQHLKFYKVPHWTETDGIKTFFGAGYEKFRGINAQTRVLPPNTRIVVLGSADKHLLDEQRLPWIREHWV
jgi:hypothetical protein